MTSLLLFVIYLSFISLGLPDSLLGSAWPSMYGPLGISVSAAGIISTIIAVGTVISSLLSDRLTKILGAGRVTAISVFLTAVALFGFSVSKSFLLLCLWAVPYGLGAGSVDAVLNNYVALHYAARHMSWLHCMWGVGASVGPYIMGLAISGGDGWRGGYRYISIIQIILALFLILSLPMWKDLSSEKDGGKPVTVKQALKIKGTLYIIVTFFCYSAVEQTVGVWAASYLVLHDHITEDYAAGLAGLFFAGITAGRMICGFLTFKLSDKSLIRTGTLITVIGICTLFIPGGTALNCLCLVIIGLGCAPIYPSIIHSTPDIFGVDKSQAIIGIQMAGAYLGTCTMPLLFGFLSRFTRISVMPVYLFVLLIIMAFMYERLLKATAK